MARRLDKRALAQAVVGAPSTAWLARLPLWRGVLVLAYHRMHRDGEQTPFDPDLLSATPSGLDAQLQLITRYFDVVSPEAIEHDRDSRGRRVMITFDDGYRDNYELALPVLREHGVPATFFLTSGFLDEPRVPWWDELAWMAKRSPRSTLEPGEWLRGPLRLDGSRHFAAQELTRIYKSLPSERTEAFLDFCADAAGTGRCDGAGATELWMTWEMAAEMRDAGMTIGGHSATHPVLARARPEVQRQEISDNARRLGEELGIPMRFFAYPVGTATAFDETTRRALREAEVELAFSLYGGYLGPGRLDPYDVPRATVGHWVTLPEFRSMLAFPGLFARW